MLIFYVFVKVVLAKVKATTFTFVNRNHLFLIHNLSPSMFSIGLELIECKPYFEIGDVLLNYLILPFVAPLLFYF